MPSKVEKTNPFPVADVEGCIARKVKRIGHLDIPHGAQLVAQNGMRWVCCRAPCFGYLFSDYYPKI